MKAIVIICISSITGWVGWWLGYHFGLFTALVLSMIGSGAGIYYGRRFNQMYD